MTRILFWNIGEQPLAGEIAHLCSHYQVDLLALAEPIDPAELTEALSRSTEQIYRRLELADRIHVYSALPEGNVTVCFDRGRSVAVTVHQTIGPPLTILFAHLPSGMSQSASSRNTLATRMRALVEQLEQEIGHKKTLVIGDLNMNPYDEGLTSSEAFHATMSAAIAARAARTIQEEERSFFYNPMWNFLGDQTRGPPGTFYWDRSEANAHYWHMLDQVLLRPDVLDIVSAKSIMIVRAAGTLRLDGADGRPSLSDHFPLLVNTAGPLPDESADEVSQEDDQ